MSEDTKRNDTGAAAPSVEDRKSSIGLNPSKKVIIKSADMKEDIQKEAIDIAIGAFEKFSVEKDVAEHIKKTFDKKYCPIWHCIVGKNFGRRRWLQFCIAIRTAAALAVNNRGWRSRATAAREMNSSRTAAARLNGGDNSREWRSSNVRVAAAADPAATTLTDLGQQRRCGRDEGKIGERRQRQRNGEKLERKATEAASSPP
ncbi:hypothetical protein SASPL_127167 [Salvia splendens]|uniref:Dynein light chain 1, cytoplasmic n=1 Tax=Salvia splendens TaxID=180675 RepID=A0A8X8XIH4_SALSN|nr:hypothetical protein SASPL_127167 [Salvia splendens]